MANLAGDRTRPGDGSWHFGHETARARRAPPFRRCSLRPEVALRIEAQRLRQLCRASLRITCACGHEGTLAVASLLDRHPRDTRLRDALASVRCSRCQRARIECVQRQD